MTGARNDILAAGGPHNADPGRYFILGTAGHIDHGKTSLVEALTGTNPDRLPEEKRRGMTIELGFAALQVGDVTFGIVDVPGHEKFVRTMVAGATAVDVALLIVAADDSVMPQTVEHVEILNLLNVRQGVVAITKCDLVDADLVDLVEEEVRGLLAGTGLAGAALVRVSSVQRTGLEDLQRELRAAAVRVQRTDLGQPFRMPIDRVFTVAGRGTVVTGSVVSGVLSRGASVDIWPTGLRARVREVQTHGHDADEIRAGQRAAVNLQGVERAAVERGFELAAIDTVMPTRLLDVSVACLRSHERPIKNNARLRLCLGTREVPVRFTLLSGAALEPGQDGLAQLRCREAVVAAYGQRFILRDENAARTAGGGLVLRAARRKISARHADAVAGLRTLLEGESRERLAAVVGDAQFDVPQDADLALAAGVHPKEVPTLLAELVRTRRIMPLEAGGRRVSAAFLESFLERAAGWLRRFHASHPDDPGCLVETVEGWLERKSDKGLGKCLLGRLLNSGRAKLMGRYVCLREFAPAMSAQDEKLLAAMLEEIRKGGFQPPAVADLVASTKSNTQRIQKLLKVACALGDLVQIDGTIYMHAVREQELRSRARELYAAQGPFTVAQLREALGSTRKYVVPIVEYLDRVGFTRRSGDLRSPASAGEAAGPGPGKTS